jgi:hypothetical protein
MDESHAPPRTQTTGTLGNIDEDTQSAVPFWDDAEPHIFYETLSVGAPSAHGMSAKMGGLWTMKDDVARLKVGFRSACLARCHRPLRLTRPRPIFSTRRSG